MKLSDLYSANPAVHAVRIGNPDLFVDIFNRAYEHVKQRLSLHPMLFACAINRGVNLNDVQSYSTAAGNGQIQFKELIDIIGQSPTDVQPHSEINPGTVYSGLTELASGITVYSRINEIYVDSSELIRIPVIAHPYPPAIFLSVRQGSFVINVPYVAITLSLLNRREDSLNVPDVMVFPITAKIHALMALEANNIILAGACDALCNHYLNIRNMDRIQIVPKPLSLVAGITPHDIS